MTGPHFDMGPATRVSERWETCFLDGFSITQGLVRVQVWAVDGGYVSEVGPLFEHPEKPHGYRMSCVGQWARRRRDAEDLAAWAWREMMNMERL